ncbi:DUF6478 family protein [Oceanomicrobium pacificus]|uniref:Uncharacterized protein n=1 Tax=Oceanomicrobium pacificus TaxID=2692916 RepID=A0A6B0TUX8_9RHOB|nr:DUF6478 family protein [Oceanomicrobium pacificus]MXU64753.1 hypothetical protein [Oceanomicrobium pacificus]
MALWPFSRRRPPQPVPDPEHMPAPLTGCAPVPGLIWGWRPDLWAAARKPAAQDGFQPWQALSGDVTLHSDDPRLTASLSQRPAQSGAFGIDLHLTDPGAARYLSLSSALPLADAARITRHDILSIDVDLGTVPDAPVFLRLNLGWGPNVGEQTQAWPAGAPDARFAFDLFYMAFDNRVLDKAWIDLIFEAPLADHLAVEDIALQRHPRATL